MTAYLAAFFLVWDARRLSDEDDGGPTSGVEPPGAAVAVGVVSIGGIFVLSNDADYLFRGLTSRALPLVILSAVCGVAALVLLTPIHLEGSALGRCRCGGQPGRRPGRRAVGLPAPTSLTVSAGAAPSGTITAILVATGLAAVLIVPAFVLLYVLDQKSLLPEEGMPEPALFPPSGSGRTTRPE